MEREIYVETFDSGSGGWLGWISNEEGAKQLEINAGIAISRSPWWIDYNHAPPGEGYLHILFCLHTKHGSDFPESYKQLGGPNRFVEGLYPTDFTNAKLTARLKGECELKGAKVVLIAQAKVGKVFINHVLTGQPFEVTSDWSEQTVTLVPDARQWKCLGSRRDRTTSYGWGEIADVLRDVNADIIFTLHPLEIVPRERIEGDVHQLRAGKDYLVDQSCLPKGCIMLDEVRIEFATEQ